MEHLLSAARPDGIIRRTSRCLRTSIRQKQGDLFHPCLPYSDAHLLPCSSGYRGDRAVCRSMPVRSTRRFPHTSIRASRDCLSPLSYPYNGDLLRSDCTDGKSVFQTSEHSIRSPHISIRRSLNDRVHLCCSCRSAHRCSDCTDGTCCTKFACCHDPIR